MVRFLFRWTARLLAGLLLLWLGLCALYAIPGVRPVSTLMLADRLLGRDVQREWVALGDIAPALRRAAIAAEDARFCSHQGVDWTALETVTQETLEGKRPRGASTIAMQTAKNLFLWPERLYIRKAAEIPMALLIDALWGKARLLEIYLNIAEFGDGLYGVQAASRHYYGRDAAALTYPQAARLIATLPNPQRNPNGLSPALQRHAEGLVTRARRIGSGDDCIP